jgi:hypothetical protein
VVAARLFLGTVLGEFHLAANEKGVTGLGLGVAEQVFYTVDCAGKRILGLTTCGGQGRVAGTAAAA